MCLEAGMVGSLGKLQINITQDEMLGFATLLFHANGLWKQIT